FDPDLVGAATSAAVAGGPDEVPRWLDIRQWTRIAPILTDRLQLCRAKGFQAVDADHGDGYAHSSGFPLTAGEQLAFDRNVVRLAHRAGLAAGVRSTTAIAAQLRPDVDFVVADACFRAGNCADYRAYVDDGKDVFDLEPSTPARVCALAQAYGFVASRSAAS